jgi:hypothetical protein
LLRECRILVLAMITTWRWDRDDQLPNGRQLGTQWLDQIRAALERKELEIQGRVAEDAVITRRMSNAGSNSSLLSGYISRGEAP